MSTLIQTPAPYITQTAIAFAQSGAAVAVGPDNPLPIGETSFRGCRAAAIGAAFAPGRAIAVVAAASGQLAIEFANGGLLDVPIEPGLTILPFAAVRVSSPQAGFAPAITLLD